MTENQNDTSGIEKWVAALRSGEFTQGKMILNRDGAYCCLGVLCELAAREGVIEKKKTNNFSSSSSYSYDGGSTAPTVKVLEWAGLPTDSEWAVEVPLGEKTAMALNDEDHKSFAEIADEIEKVYLGVTV